MKRFLLWFSILLGLAGPACAGDATNFTAALIDHVHAQTVFDVHGLTRLELTDAVVQAIPYRGSYVLEGQLGFSGTTVPQAGESVYGHAVASALIRLDPYFKNVIIFPANYALLSSVEYGPVYGYDFEERHGYLGFQANLAFGLNPIK